MYDSDFALTGSFLLVPDEIIASFFVSFAGTR
jgi:hypothetical protein